MTTIYLVRHGQSLANLHHICAGHTDFELSELGLAQAEAAGAAFAKLPITAIYASDLIRAVQTATPTAKRLGLPITTMPELREHFAGDWDGVHVDEVTARYPKEEQAWLADPEHNDIPGSEPVPAVRVRMMNAIRKIAEAHDGKHVLITSHCNAIRIFLSGVRGTDFSHSDPLLSNVSLTTVLYDKGTFTIQEINNCDHLLQANIPITIELQEQH